MKRREAIKNLSLGIGYVVSAPAVFGILESCSKGQPEWESVFFKNELRSCVDHLVDVILPPSESPGGLELDLPRFVDKMSADILSPTDQELVSRGGALFAELVADSSGKAAGQSTRQEVLKVFETYFDLPPDEKKRVLETQGKEPGEIDEEEKDNYALYKFLFVIREFALLGYFTSEKVGKEYLVFDPIPGVYKPCIPISEVGNAWTIG